MYISICICFMFSEKTTISFIFPPSKVKLSIFNFTEFRNFLCRCGDVARDDSIVVLYKTFFGDVARDDSIVVLYKTIFENFGFLSLTCYGIYVA